jgi:hypothetical protein
MGRGTPPGGLTPGGLTIRRWSFYILVGPKWDRRSGSVVCHPARAWTIAIVLSFSHHNMVGVAVAVGFGHDHARVELVERANRLSIQKGVYSHTCDGLARHDRVEKPPRTSGNPLGLPEFVMKFRGPKAHPNRPRKTMVCPTFSTKYTNSRGGLTIRRRLTIWPHKVAGRSEMNRRQRRGTEPLAYSKHAVVARAGMF